MSHIEHIRDKLANLEVRQLLRDASRRQASILRKAYRFRKLGRFDHLLHLQCGMTLCYDRAGKLCWASAPRITQDNNQQCEMEFISDSDPALPSVSSPQS